MNERIKELEAQCWEHDQSWTGEGNEIGSMINLNFRWTNGEE